MATRRRAVGVRLTAVAETLYGQRIDKMGAGLQGDLQFLSQKEQEAVAKVEKTMAACEITLRKLAKRFGAP